MIDYQIYAAGEFIITTDELLVKNPFTGENIAKTYLATNKIIEDSIQRALSVQSKMRDMSTYEKSEILKFISAALLQQKNRLSEILSMESAKPLKYSQGEVARAAQTFLIASEECKRIPSEYLLADWTADAQGKEAIVKYFPIGLVAGITPFNFPLNLAAHKIAPAFAAGCPIIIKPASVTPLSCLELAKIVDQTALPKGAFTVIPMTREKGSVLIEHKQIKLITFTGSPEVGWAIKQQCGKKKVVLELGGNAAAVITPTANLEKAVKRCILGAFSYSGQVCIHTQRLIIHETIFEVFVEKFIELAKQLKYGNPIDAETDISSMIDEANAVRVEQWLLEAKHQGAEIILGGERIKNFVSPTVVNNVNPQMKIYKDEVFGPVVTVEKYSSFNEALYKINNSDYGLQAGIFTNNINEMDHSFRELEVGGVIINDVPTFRADHLPYGGIKNSGFGREGVKYAMLDMLEPKCLIKNSI